MRLKELHGVRQKLEKRLAKYPEGSIHVIKSKTRIQYYLRIDPKDKSGRYLSKREVNKIKTFLQKKYDTEALNCIKKEISTLERFIKKSELPIQTLQNIYSNNPKEIKRNIEPLDISDEDYIEEWLSKSYERKIIHEDLPVYVTDKGDRVRSKSELNIANTLFKMNIPYKYECPLILSNGIIIHPDFTLLDVARRREIYWEHRGMMDDRYYLKHALLRVKDYAKEGIFVGDRLIITEEASFLPLVTDEIHIIVNQLLRK